MNVFVLCTGRCGSLTLTKACKHMTNFTSGHETRTDYIGKDRIIYPENHIEVDNRLSWFLGKLDAMYGPGAVYVHLTRSPEDVAKSYAQRFKYTHSIVNAYKTQILLPIQRQEDVEVDDFTVCRDYVDTVTMNIEHFLKDKPYKVKIRVERFKEDFKNFWNYIDAQGDIEAALKELDIQYNKP